MGIIDTVDRTAIARACRAHGAKRLRMFGSATTDRYEPGRSDVDFLVEFFENLPNAFRAYFGLKADLEKIVESPVDLVDDSAIRNPIFARSARIGAVEIYAA